MAMQVNQTPRTRARILRARRDLPHSKKMHAISKRRAFLGFQKSNVWKNFHSSRRAG
jgi:hypothetical protein